MKEQNTHKKSWWERNKKKVFVIGGIAVLTGIGYVVFRNKDALLPLVKSGGKKVAVRVKPIVGKPMREAASEKIANNSAEVITDKKPINNGMPFGVRGGIRNLPNGYHPSPEKIAQALKCGIVLGEHQTLVCPYMKNAA